MDSDRPTSFRGFADFLQLIFQHNYPFPWILGAVSSQIACRVGPRYDINQNVSLP
jgi:hypothetical protein